MDNLPGFRQVLASPRGIIAIILVILVITSLVAVSTTRNSNTGQSGTTGGNQNQLFATPLSSHLVVYGVWDVANDKSLIKGLNLTTGNEHIIAELPGNVKRVDYLSSDQLIYIADTDGVDHGQFIAQYSLADNQTAQIISADTGFAIDDYALSRNGQYIALWEIAKGANGLIGGSSKVYLVNLADGGYTKQLLSDEQIAEGEPVFYPTAVSNDGYVVLDRWVANDETSNGMGFGWGLYLSDGSGNKQEIAAPGSYSTQPVLSPDGNNIAFAGYSGSKGSGTATGVGGFRNAQLYPDRVMVYNLQSRTLEQQTDSVFTDAGNIFPKVYWDNTSGKLLVMVSGSNADAYGFYSYDINAKVISRLHIGEDDTPLAMLDGDKVFTGIVSDITPVNLGSGYDYPYTNPRVFDPATNEQFDLQVTDILLQYLGTYPLDSFQNVLGDSTVTQQMTNASQVAQANTSSNRVWTRKNIYQETSGNRGSALFDTSGSTPAAGPTGKDRLQLQSFPLMPSLAPVRQTQQSLPKCKDLATEQCIAQGLQEGSSEFRACYLQQRKANSLARACYDSPLYLYGEEGASVTVKAHTPVFNSTPDYNDGYRAVLQANGVFTVNNKQYESISYDYKPAVTRVDRPSYGTVTTREHLDGVVRYYAHRLGLNDRETADLVVYAQENVDSPYVFVSFFSQEDSKRILPLSFVPDPDTYVNYVFYFKKLSEPLSYTPISPFFPPVPTRGAFTAVEISGFVE